MVDYYLSVVSHASATDHPPPDQVTNQSLSVIIIIVVPQFTRKVSRLTLPVHLRLLLLLHVVVVGRQ